MNLLILEPSTTMFNAVKSMKLLNTEVQLEKVAFTEKLKVQLWKIEQKHWLVSETLPNAIFLNMMSAGNTHQEMETFQILIQDLLPSIIRVAKRDDAVLLLLFDCALTEKWAISLESAVFELSEKYFSVFGVSLEDRLSFRNIVETLPRLPYFGRYDSNLTPIARLR